MFYFITFSAISYHEISYWLLEQMLFCILLCLSSYNSSNSYILKFIVYTRYDEKINIISGVSCSFKVCLETKLEPLDIMIEEPILVK